MRTRRRADGPHPNQGTADDPSATAAQRLGAYCADLTWAHLPVEVRERAAYLTLDLIGVAIRGSAEPSSRAVRAATDRYTTTGGSSAIGIPSRVVAPAAALVNGTTGHAIELDDVTRASSLHPGVAVIPAVLAVAEQRAASGRAFLEAVVAGYEVTIRVGNALNPASAYARGFHPTGVAGAFGAAAACARLRGSDGPTVARAISIAGTMASGSMEYLADGTWTKRLNAGWASQSGVVAADLAEAGFSGPASALEGRFGAMQAYTDDPIPRLLTEGLGGSHQIADVAIKPYACCRYNHGLIDGVLRIRNEQRFDPSEVRRIRLGVLSAGAALVADPIDLKRAPGNPVDAQFSAPYAAAIALVHGAAGIAQYAPDVIGDPRIRRLMVATDCYTSPELDDAYPQRWPAEVEIVLNDGRVFRSRVEYAYGEPENPISEGALRGKFRDLASDGLGVAGARRIEEMILRLGDAPSVRPLGDALRAVRVA